MYASQIGLATRLYTYTLSLARRSTDKQQTKNTRLTDKRSSATTQLQHSTPDYHRLDLDLGRALSLPRFHDRPSTIHTSLHEVASPFSRQGRRNDSPTAVINSREFVLAEKRHSSRLDGSVGPPDCPTFFFRAQLIHRQHPLEYIQNYVHTAHPAARSGLPTSLFLLADDCPTGVWQHVPLNFYPTTSRDMRPQVSRRCVSHAR